MAAPISLRADFDVSKSWRLIDLAEWVFDENGLSAAKQILSRELRALDCRKLSARPRHHEHDEAAVADFKKSPELLATIATSNGKPLELRGSRSRCAPNHSWRF